MKKVISKVMVIVISYVLISSITGCGGANNNAGANTNLPITVISREEGSGTRSAFIELFKVQDENKVDNTVATAEIMNSTGVVMTAVESDKNAIGYISMGSLNNKVKALKINGVDATPENVSNGTYVVSRPFYIAVNRQANANAADFINFILSTEGQDIVTNNGFVRIADLGTFNSANPSGKVVVAGSSSVTPVMEKLKEGYEAINANLTIEIQQSDSSAGMTAAIDGICDIGMSSRNLKDSELEKGLIPILIANDGLAVIVNKENAISDTTIDQVKGIYLGDLTTWADVAA